jgi:hypothetical protein
MKKNVALSLVLFLPLLCSSVSFGEESLLQAVTQGNEMSAKTLLAAGAEVDTRDEIGKTPLNIAADKGYLPVVELQTHAKILRGRAAAHGRMNGRCEI